MYIGTQLFGILNNQRGKDPKEVLSALAAIGFDSVEPCLGLFDMGPLSAAFLPPEKLKELLPFIRGLGMTVPACHAASEDPLKDLPVFKDLAENEGIKAFVFGFPEKLSETSLQEYAFTLRTLADSLKDSGAEIWLHNNKAETETLIGGRTAYEYLADICLGRVFLEPDTGWLAAGNTDPVQFLARNESRIKALHFKDFADPGTDTKDTCIGSGSLDLDSCLQFARAHEIPVIIDQDMYETFPDDAKKSFGYLTGLSYGREHSVSYLNVLDTETGEVKILHRYGGVIEAPNWVAQDNTLIFNFNGHIYRYSFEKDQAEPVETGFLMNCNNDHVVSSDGKWLAVSDSGMEEHPVSNIYKVSLEDPDEDPVPVTKGALPSYLHGWSPDMSEMAFCGFRMTDAGFAVDVYSVPADGGEEKRLTNEGFNDGPEYSPDGKKIWFISTRTGLMQVYKMNTDGSCQEQMTFEDRNNWFGHVSPDGKKVVNISYNKGGLKPNEHLPNMEVELWLMNEDGSDRRKLLSFFGGQGSINVNSWAPDSRHLAFVSYDVIIPAV